MVEFAPEISLGNVLTMIVAGGTTLSAIAFAFVRTKWQGEQNTLAIDALRAERERAALSITAQVSTDIKSVREDMRREVELLHKRQGDNTEKLTEAIGGLTIEVRAMHAENYKFRERVATELVSYARLGEVMKTIDTDFKQLGDRLDKIIDKLIQGGWTK